MNVLLTFVKQDCANKPAINKNWKPRIANKQLFMTLLSIQLASDMVKREQYVVLLMQMCRQPNFNLNEHARKTLFVRSWISNDIAADTEDNFKNI